eukprot:m.47842 g.47842  ORF g.47842 m.47842 type:complete len:52 (-) comp17706_c0_seq1:124-279(-)
MDFWFFFAVGCSCLNYDCCHGIGGSAALYALRVGLGCRLLLARSSFYAVSF